MPGPFDINWQDMSVDLTRVTSVAVTALAWVVGGAILYRVGRRVIRGSAVPKYVFRAEVAARSDTARELLLSAWKYVVLFGVLAALVAMMPIAIVPAAAIVTASGLVVGLGVQSLFRDVIAGFSILVEGQFAVGDRVKLIGVDVEGTIEAVGLRVTVVRDEDGSRVFVPNGAITAVRNWSDATDEQLARRARSRPRGRRDEAQADPVAPIVDLAGARDTSDDAEREARRRRGRRRGGRGRRRPNETPREETEEQETASPSEPREILDNSPWSIE